jgi:putative ABC transport system permease protein
VTYRLVLENLKHRPMRSLLSTLLIGVPVTLILCLVGLSTGMLEDSQRRARGVGADILVRGSNAASVVSFSGATINEKMVDFLQTQIPHVKLAMGANTHPIQLPLFVIGIDLKKFTEMNGGFQYLEGGPLRGPDDMLVDRFYAAEKHLHPGSTINLMNKTWHIAGIIEGGKLARIVVEQPELQKLDAATGKVNQVYLKLDNPANTAAVIQEIKEKVPGLVVNSMEEITSMYNVNNFQGLREFIWVIMGIGVVIGFFVVCLSMYMAVLQRTREIGILKSLGASKGFILRIILAEAVALGIGGTVIGVLLSYGAYYLIRTLIPASIPMIIVKSWWPIAGMVTLVGALLGALYPGLNAARQDPIEALSYE